VCLIVVDTFKQFFTWDVSIDGPNLENSAPFGPISTGFKDSTREYLSSKQNNDEFRLHLLNFVQNILIVISLIVLYVIVSFKFFRGLIDQRLIWIILIVLAYGVINSFICANLSTVNPRFQNRWI